MKRQSKNILIALMICVVSGGLFMTIAHLIGNGDIEGFDLSIIQFVQGVEAPWLTTVFTTFTWIGSAYLVVPITLLVCYLLFFIERKRLQAILFAFSMVGTIALNELLKRYFQRERPELYRLLDAGGYSFPSGHTMMAFSLYGMISYLLWRKINTAKGRTGFLLFALFMAFTIAISRIYLGVHYPSDIVGGIAMSTFWITIIITIDKALHARQRAK